jgi:hypothetical protein
MLKDMFLAPGRYICRKFSRSRKKSRYQSRTLHKGPVVPISIFAWLLAVGVAYGLVVWLGSPPIPRDLLEAQNSAPPPAATTAASQPQAGAAASTAPQTTTTASGNLTASAPNNSTEAAGSSLVQSVSPPAVTENVPPPEVWLVIVESIPKKSRTEAEQSQARHKKRGVDLELLDTDAYPLLKSGMWTLAMGPFDTKLEAEAAALEIKPKVRDLMVRRGL